MVPKILRGCLLATFFLPLRTGAQDLEQVRDAKWFGMRGTLGSTAFFYGVQGIPERRVPFSYVLSGSATFAIKSIEVPFSFQISEQQRSFRQPFNQIGFSPRYKWATAHLGYRSVSFSRYTLDNHVFLGGGVELNPGKFRFGAVYGRFLRAVTEDPARQVYNAGSQYPVAAFDRYGYAVKLGVGTATNFFDLIYFKGQDQQGSVPRDPEIQVTAPGENATAGLKTHVTLWKKFFFEADAALSVFTRDLRADTVSIEDNSVERIAKAVLLPRLSTSVYYAGDAAIGWKDARWGLAVRYNRVAPDYRSMGIYYIQTDVQRVTLAPNWSNKKGTVQAAGSLGVEGDNLEEKKLAQTNRIIGNASLNLAPKPHWGLSLQYTNFGISQRPGLRPVNDTVVLDQITQSAVVSPRYTIQGANTSHTFVYLLSLQNLNDRNALRSVNYDLTTVNNTLSYVLGLPSGLSVDASAYRVSTSVQAGTSVSNGAAVGASQTFGKARALASALSANWSTNEFGGQSDGSTLQLRTTHTVTFLKKHRLRLDATYTDNKSLTEAVSKSFQEYVASIGYSYTF